MTGQAQTRPHQGAKQPQLNSRAAALLKQLVAQYIDDGQPVGSKTLARYSGLSLSSATIRNVMADLEDSGLISAPHTSAGRIPTAQGYRLFVDQLIQVNPLDIRSVISLQSGLADQSRSEDAIRSASSMLSSLTHFAGLVTAPRRDRLSLKHIEFVDLDSVRVLIILVFNDGEVQNRIIEKTETLSRTNLEQVAALINGEYLGMSLGEIRTRLVQDITLARDRVRDLMDAAIEVAQTSLEDHVESLVMNGETNLMAYAEFSEVDKLKELFDAFRQKSEILQLLEECSHAEGVRLFIGEESGIRSFRDCSVVTAPYSLDGQIVGVLGVIGPTRMAYDKVIPVVDATARILGEILNPGA